MDLDEGTELITRQRRNVCFSGPFFSLVVAVFALATVRAAPHAGDWKSAEIVSFKDFDDMEIKLDGKSWKKH